MSRLPECVAPTGCLLGQGPLWSPTEGFLWWVDAARAKLHRHNPKTGNTRRYDLPIHASAIALHHGGFIMIGDREGGLYDPATEAYERQFELPETEENIRAHDAGVAPDGSLWLCVKDVNEYETGGRFYRVSPEFAVSQLALPTVFSANTMRFSPDNKTFYTCDTAEQEILAHDFDPETNTLSERRVFATTDEWGGYPMGSAIDAQGCLWTALWDGGCAVRYSPDGIVDRIAELPVMRPTGCAFGGPELSTLYITTARQGFSPRDLERQPFSGGLFALDVPTPGAPQRVFGDF